MTTQSISVKGTGTITHKVDSIELFITLCNNNVDYQTAMNKSLTDTDIIKKSLLALDINKDDIKSLSYDIKRVTKSIHDTNGGYRTEFLHYSAMHRMKLCFDYDIAKLGDIVNALGTSGVNPEFEFSFTVKDKQALKQELLLNAISDAKNKAQIIANGVGLKLAEILSIDYNFDKCIPASPFNLTLAKAHCDSIDINPEDVSMTDSINVVWRTVNS